MISYVTRYRENGNCLIGIAWSQSILQADRFVCLLLEDLLHGNLLSIPHKGILSDWLPPFIEDALNKVISYTTRMTQRNSRSSESLYCVLSLELIHLKIQYANEKLQGIMLHKVSEAVLPMGLSASISPTSLTDVRGIRSLVPHLIGPLRIGPPTHWSPNTLLELIGTPSHWSPISLVPHLIGPPFHSSPHHRPIPMVPRLIGPPTHQSLISLVPQLAPMHHPFHWFPISLVPQLISPPSHWSPN